MRNYVVLAALLLLPLTSFAGGKEKAAVCVACHGEKGISANPLWPNLAGQKKEYLVKQLLAFRSGERKDPLMAAIGTTLSEQDVQDLAAYFATLGTH